jgi:hypothetical protein
VLSSSAPFPSEKVVEAAVGNDAVIPCSAPQCVVLRTVGLFGGWGSMAGALIEAVVFYLYAVLLLRLAGKTTMGTARIFDFVSTVAMGTMVGSTIISPTSPSPPAS